MAGVLDIVTEQIDLYAAEHHMLPAEIVITSLQAGKLSVELGGTNTFVTVTDGSYLFGSRLRIIPEPRGGTLDLTEFKDD